MFNSITKEESYAERRQLFKNIWETAMNIDDKDPDIMNKPKVIKTLRLDEVDRCAITKKKKERIRNLRHVCNKILDFCDRQDADDIFYEQLAIEGHLPQQYYSRVETKMKKFKKMKHKKIKKAKSLSTTVQSAQAKITTSEKNDEFHRDFGTKTSRNTSPIKIKRTTVVKKSAISTKSVKDKYSKNMGRRNTSNASLRDMTTAAFAFRTTKHGKGLKGKNGKRKKRTGTLVTNVNPPGIIDWSDIIHE